MQTNLVLPQHLDENVRVVVYATMVLRPAGPVQVRRSVQYFDDSQAPGVRVYRDENVTGLDDELYEWLNDTLASVYRIAKELEKRYHPSLPFEGTYDGGDES